MRRFSWGVRIGAISLILAALAFVPGTGPFTPAILLTVVALGGALVAAILGALRLATLTLFIICATFILASRTFDSLIRVDYLMVAFAVAAVVLGLILYGQYKRQSADT